VLTSIRFLIVAHGKSVHVYSTSNSLLHRSINLFVDESLIEPQYIAAYGLSPTDPNILWLACSDGTVYKVNWASGEGGDRSWKTSDAGLTHMTVASMDSDGRKRDVVFTTEKKGEVWRISAHELSIRGTSPIVQSRVIYTSPKPIHIIKTTGEGDVIIAASEERVLLGTLRSTDFGTIERIKYEFRIFESTDFVSSMDIRVSKRAADPGRKVTKLDKIGIVDVVVGDVRGAIFVHNDLLANLIRSQTLTVEVPNSINLIPRKLHWHRKAVHSVKWSLDGRRFLPSKHGSS
jgi:NET1-associated nuclear protein 1 (U3 small nucleolar RNA-associated protein 17)